MPQVDERQAAIIRTSLASLTRPVTIVSYTSDVDSWYSRAERELLEAVAAASPLIRLDVRADRWDGEREGREGIRRTPAIAVVGARDVGLRYYGMPDGYELEPFLATLAAVAEGRDGLQEPIAGHVRALQRPLHIEVLASPT